MKKVTILIITTTIILGLASCGSKQKKDADETKREVITPERPTDAELHAYKAYHHTRYMVQTADAAGGTNKLLHTKELPTEGTDPVVSPALDHLYSKAVIDLSEGSATVEIPEGIDDRYWSIHITDQEHYTIFDEIRPVGKYTFIRQGKGMKIPKGATIIECPGNYPHLFIRIQVKTPNDMVNTLAVQEKIKLSGISKNFNIASSDYVRHVIDTHDIYPENEGLLETVKDFSDEDYLRVNEYVGFIAPKFGSSGNMGCFGPINSMEPNSNNPEYRAAAIIGHLGLPVQHAYYGPFFTNCNDELLNGDKTEVFVLPYKPAGVQEFWSITRYSALTRNTIPGKNDVFNAYNTKPDKSGNVTITFSVNDPKDGTYWMPVNAGEPYYFVCRYYKPNVNDLPKKPCQ